MNLNKKKVVFIASSGGHLTQLLQLSSLFPEFDSYLITEKDTSTSDLIIRYKGSVQVLYMPETRKNHMMAYLKGNIISLLLSIKYFWSIKPDIVISTGAGISVYLTYLSKLFGKKIVFIETYAAIKKKSMAGRLIYPIADKFYIQWESLKKIYPKGIYKGSLY